MKPSWTPHSHKDGLSFLKPKVTPPRPPLGMIGRPRLTDLVAKVETSLLTVVCAPAGYGKTTIALAWADTLRHRGGLVAWLSLDPEDDDPLRFMHYVLRALEQPASAHDDGEGARWPGQIGASAGELLSAALNHVMEHGEEVYLFVDDFQHLAGTETQELVMTMLRHAPSNFHLVLMSREALALPLSHFRAHGQLLEVGAHELRFTADETDSLLHANALPATYTHEMHALTNGWAAALQLAVLARKNREEVASEPKSGGLARLSELACELLAHLPAEEVAFLEQTSVAERLCAPLCEAMTGMTHGQAMLERLERRMLLSRLTEDGIWFSCHQLLREVLIARLRSTGRDAVQACHHSASQWYARKSSWSDAVRHALLAGDATQAVKWIEQCAMTLVKRGDLLTLLNWESQLRTALVGCPLSLRLAILWAHVLGAYKPENVRLLDAIEEESHQSAPGQEARIHWECQIVRAITLAQGEQPCSAHKIAEACVRAPQGDAWMVNSIYNVLVLCHLRARRWSDFYASPVLPYREGEHESNVFSSIYRFTLRGLGHFQQLQASAAQKNLNEALQLGMRHTGEPSLPTTLPAVLLARLHYERMELNQAAQLLEGRLSLVPASGFGDAIAAAFTVAARLECRQGNVEHANEILEQACSIAHGLGFAHLEVIMLYEREQLLLRHSRLWEAQACVKRIEQLVAQPHSDADIRVEMTMLGSLACCQLDAAQGRTEAAVAGLHRWHDWAAERGDYYLALHCTALLAVALAAGGQLDGAHAALARYFELAGPHGFKATLLDAGKTVDALLKSFSTTPAARSLGPSAALLLRALTEPGAEPASATLHPHSTILSPRERHILSLIAQEKSNKEISRALNIAPETVKTHIKHIFSKLEVTKRTLAVKRGLSLGILLPPEQI
ncbi:LuxR C-terminal-related transcriptional regulator [Paraburkholderia sacchari]|uniref:helix-turn-helix transcriptional regulator n=1 Tax=Paraburkholderia sacchari TaxID=159450 RepID=UPI0039A51533